MSLKNNISRIINIPLINNTFKLSAGTVIMMGISILVTPILTRLYTPEDYGIWGIISSVATIISSVIFLSYEYAIVQSDDEKEIPGLITLCVICALSVILLTAIVFILGSLSGITFFSTFPSLPCLLIILLVTFFNYLALIIANRYSFYSSMSYASMAEGASQAATRLLFGSWIPIKGGLVWGNIISIIISALIIFKKTLRYFRETHKKFFSFDSVRYVAVKYKKYPIFDAPAKLIEYSLNNIVLIILSAYFDKTEIGCYTILVQLMLLPITLIGTQMSRVSFQELAESINDREKFSILSQRLIKICSLLSVLPILFFVLGGDAVLVWILGEGWQDASKMALCLSIFSVPVILSEPLLPIFKVVNKQNIRFLLNVIGFIVIILSLVIGISASNSIYVVLILYSIAYALSRLALFYYEIKLMNTDIKLNFKLIAFIVGTYILLAIRLYFAL